MIFRRKNTVIQHLMYINAIENLENEYILKLNVILHCTLL